MMKRKDMTKNVYYEFFFFFFQLLRYQNAKMEKEKTLPKSCNLNVFHIVRQQNTIMLARYTRKLNNNVRNVFLCVFQRVRHENAKQHGKHLIQKCKIISMSFKCFKLFTFQNAKTRATNTNNLTKQKKKPYQKCVF